jgi:predicted outer membrane repeat protein
MSEEEVRNSLNPRDGTEVASAQNNPPVPVCEDNPNPVYGDTLAGFLPFGYLRLDACASRDPDSLSGDYVKNFYWESVELCVPTADGQNCVPFFVGVNNYQCLQNPYFTFGGAVKFRLTVGDKFGLRSEVYDSVVLSVQYPPLADAGEDHVLRPESTAYLNGSGIEINPDQRDLLRFSWRWVEDPPAITPIFPSDTVASIRLTPRSSGIYRLALTVRDPYAISQKDDEVVVVANQAPQAHVDNVDHAFEGSVVYLDGSRSYDLDSAIFQHEDSATAGPLEFSWSVKSSPAGAQAPVIVDADQPIANFIPYGAGLYTFRLLVNDTLSVNQPQDSVRQETGTDTLANVAFLEVVVDSTYAYPIIQGNLIYDNLAGSKGGAIDCNGSSPDIISNVFYKNQSQLSGGAICARNFSTPQIKSNVFFGNISSDSTGGAIADLGAQFAPSATRGFRKNLAVQYNDFWDNGGGDMYQASGDISNNIFSFPGLYDPDFGDFIYECNSPCFGAGDPLHPNIGELVFFPGCVAADRLNMVAVSFFQNPEATAAARFIVNTDVPLEGYPVGYVTIGGNAPSPVYFSPIASKTYLGSYVFTASGSAEVSIFATSLLGRDTVVVNTMSVQLIGAGKTGELVSADGKVGVLFADGSVKEDVYATCFSVAQDSRYEFEGDPEMEAFGEPYQLGPSISFDKYTTISFWLRHLNPEGKDKTLFSIYRYEEGEWNRLESYPDGDKVCAEAKTLGVFRLIYDPNAKPLTNIPQTYQLFQNYPNPFNPETQIKYDLPVSGNVTLSVYNVLGQRVRVLADGFQEAGHKSVIWDGKDNQGREAASGIYFYKIEAENYQMTKKMVLLK